MSARALAGLALCAGCAATGEAGGGAANLPARGIIPYEKVAILRGARVTAFVLPPGDGNTTTQLVDPTALVVDGRVVLFAARRLGADAEIVRVEAPDGVAFGAPAVVYAGEGVGAPSVARAADGTWHLAFETPEGLAHLASRDGRDFGDAPDLWLAPEGETLSSPALVAGPDGLRLYYTTTPAATDDARPAIALAEVDAAGRATRRGVVLGPGEGCAEACWDAKGVRAPDVRVATTAAGRTVWRMFYDAPQTDDAALGFAASFDGVTWERFAFNPVLDADLSETEPAAALLDDTYLLYFTEGTRRAGVALALSAEGPPAERF